MREGLDAELALGPAGDQYVVCSLAAALGRCRDRGPYPELARALAEMPYSYGRRFVVDALARTEPAFARAGAYEALFDCEPETRLAGIEVVEAGVPKARRRLEALTGDRCGDKDVRASATRRLRSSRP